MKGTSVLIPISSCLPESLSFYEQLQAQACAWLQTAVSAAEPFQKRERGADLLLLQYPCLAGISIRPGLSWDIEQDNSHDPSLVQEIGFTG